MEFRTLTFRFVLAACSAVAFSVSGSYGADSSSLNRSVSGGGAAPAAPASKPNGLVLPNEVSCGIVCRYNRANDNLTLQAVYLLRKISLIGSAVGKDDNKALTAMGGFCTNGGEEASDCFTRYKDFQRVALLEIRQAIGRNEDAIARLTSGRKEDGSVDKNGIAYDIGEERAGYVPDVPTLSDLEAAYKRGQLGKSTSKYTAADVRKWSQELVRSNPLAKTIEFKKETVEGNPYQSEKTSYRLFMTKKDGNGGDQTDPKEAALREKSKASIEGYASNKDIDVTDVKAVTPGQSQKEDSLSYEAYKQARSNLNSKIEGDLKKDGERAAERKLANTKDAKTKPSSEGDTKSAEVKEEALSREVKITGSRSPSGTTRSFDVEERVKTPESLKNSRYIKYNLNDLYKDIEESTK